MKQNEYTNIRAVYNSCLYYANNFFEESKKTEKLQAISSMFDLFDLNIYMNFQTGLNYQSFLQKGIDYNFTKPVFLIVDFLLEELDTIDYCDVFVQDLPQLLS